MCVSGVGGGGGRAHTHTHTHTHTHIHTHRVDRPPDRGPSQPIQTLPKPRRLSCATAKNLQAKSQKLCVCASPMDPSTEPTRSPISTNQRREMLLFLARIFGSHAGITNNGSAHTDSVRFCRFWFNRPTAKWLYGCLKGNQLRTISSSNLRIKLRHH